MLCIHYSTTCVFFFSSSVFLTFLSPAFLSISKTPRSLQGRRPGGAPKASVIVQMPRHVTQFRHLRHASGRLPTRPKAAAVYLTNSLLYLVEYGNRVCCHFKKAQCNMNKHTLKRFLLKIMHHVQKCHVTLCHVAKRHVP